MKKKKSRKKLVIGVGVLIVAVVAGVNIYGSMNAADSAIPQVKTVSAVRDNVQQTVEISGTVVSEEQKTYFSPVNAKVDTAALKEGETVKAGSSLIEFDQKDLEREAKKADLNVESGKMDMKNTLKKSDEAVRKQQNAAGDAASLKQQVAAQARAAMGIWLMTGANRNMEIKSPTAWNIPVRRVFAPERMATLVRAMAAVAGMPPKKGSRMLPTPWAMSS